MNEGSLSKFDSFHSCPKLTLPPGSLLHPSAVPVKKCLEIKQQSKLLRRESTYLPKFLKKTAPKKFT
jgi:hypothetical protein